MRNLNLETEKEITIVKQESIKVNATEIVIHQVIDNGIQVVAELEATSYRFHIILWEGADYTTIGQWTDDDVNNRIKQLL